MASGLLQRIEALERIVAMQAHIISARDAEILRLNEIIRTQAETIKTLNEKISKLEARLNTNSSNSSKPPSTDPPWKKPKEKSNGSGKGKRGAQKGHSGVARELLPVEEVNDLIQCTPSDTCACGGPVVVDTSSFARKQVFEIPQIKPHITEYQVFSGQCSCCGANIRGELPKDVPSGILGSQCTGDDCVANRQIPPF